MNVTQSTLANKVDTALTEIEGTNWQDISPMEWSKKTRKYVISNEVCFLLGSDEYPSFVTAKRDKRERLLEALRLIVPILRENDVSFCLVKFPSVEKPIGDIDILIFDSNSQEAAFRDAGFELQNQTEPHREAYTRTIDGEMITIDVHTRVSWRRVEYADTESVIRESVTNKLLDGTSYPAPRPEHDLLVVAAHSIFDKRKITLFEALYGGYLYSQSNIQVSRDMADQFNWLPEFDQFCKIATSTIEAPEKVDLTSFPYHVPTRNVISYRLHKMIRDLIDGRFKTVGRELIGYPQDILTHIFEERLGISLWPVFQTITRIKRAIYRG